MSEQAVSGLLDRIPETWQEFDPDKLTATEADALSQLVAGGLVERRYRLRVRVPNHPTAIEAELESTGEFGLAEAMDAVAKTGWNEWREAIGDWKRSGAGNDSPFISERLPGDAWRLTTDGVEARENLAHGNRRVVLDFILKRSYLAYRPLVRGEGRLVKLERITNGPPSTVANRDEGGQATKLPKEEKLAEIRRLIVSGVVKIREIQKETGFSTGFISQSLPYRVYREGLAKRNPKVQRLTTQMLEAKGQKDDPAARLQFRESIWEKIYRNAKPAEQAKLDAMPGDKRDSLIDTYIEHLEDSPESVAECSP